MAKTLLIPTSAPKALSKEVRLVLYTSRNSTQSDFTWEKTDKAELLRKEAGL
jgi:hypothetical protein